LRNQIFGQYLPEQNEFESMRYFLTLTLCLQFAVFSAFSTTITGTVIDAASGKPLESATVFLSGTTFGAITRTDGSFTLNFTPSGSSQFVIAHLGYQTYTKNVSEIPLDQPLKVELQIRSLQLSTVSVIGYDSNRKKNMAEFIFGFFGDSECGKKCTILNPNVIHLERRFIPGKIGQDELIAYADSNLIIENKSLGYTIRYTLESFNQTKYSTIFKGYPLFMDNLSKIKNKERIQENRERAYQGSQMHFFRSLFNKTLQQDGFQIFKIEKQKHINLLGNSYGLMADTVFVPEPSQHMVQTEIQLNLYNNLYLMEKTAALDFKSPFEIRYTLNGEDRAYRNNSIYHIGMKRNLGQQTTIVTILENPLVFYPNGSLKNAGNIVTIGYWSFKRVGEIMPWDYQPPKTSKEVVTLH